MLPAVILAAGQGHRLLESSGGVPKPLVPVLGVPLLERTLLACRAAGITEVFVVLGYRQELLRPAIAAWARRYDMALHVVENPVWVEGNGTSALAVAPYLSQAFFLLMCDHVFTPAMLGQLLAAEDGTEVCRLAVDRRIEAIFDLPDATKVRLDGPRITAIGKDIAPFDAIDTGLFLCRPFLFKALERARAAGDSSLSGGMRQLLTTGQLQAVDIGDAFLERCRYPGEPGLHRTRPHGQADGPSGVATPRRSRRSSAAGRSGPGPYYCALWAVYLAAA